LNPSATASQQVLDFVNAAPKAGAAGLSEEDKLIAATLIVKKVVEKRRS